MSDPHTIHLHLLLLSGELLPEQEEAIREHHCECSVCRADLDKIRHALQQYQAQPESQASPAVIAGLQRAARQVVPSAWQGKIQRLFHVEWLWLQAAALTAAIVVLAVMVARSSRMVTRPLPVSTASSVEVDQNLTVLQNRLALFQTEIKTETNSSRTANTFDALVDKELVRVRQRMEEWTSDLLFSENQ
jgi:hypothetical protein